ncbi:hypothetical protein MJO28_013763 [Puccinia striiformis f. sp. tritici]|uniref:Uncharacterized protein n=1 Tax=Puccinia striiformis f. sp. tritici TaxID=168172 RepID=A0ACC0DVQ4_9BASI|nr:hypothetical protein MJO28_013763 [Puccinia striiformis f. sp. tritici]
MPTFDTQSNTTLDGINSSNGAPKTLNKGDELLQTKVALAQDHLKLEEKKFKLKKEHQLSEVQLNKLKILRESEDNLDDKAKEAISLIKKKIKSKWLSSVV